LERTPSGVLEWSSIVDKSSGVSGISIEKWEHVEHDILVSNIYNSIYKDTTIFAYRYSSILLFYSIAV
jgi:hypothetical protein